jgi:D-3-phosphoglycerate dehydrogenase
MKRFKIVKVENDHALLPWVATRFEEAGIDFRLVDCRTAEDLRQHAADADAVWVFSGYDLLRGANLNELKRCRLILRTGSGVDNVDTAHAAELGIPVANTPLVFAEAVADHAVALLLGILRDVPHHDRRVRQGLWPQMEPALRLMRNSTVGLVSFGQIARRVARRLSGFELTILASDPFVGAEIMAEYGVQSVALEDLLQRSHFVSLHTPYMPATHHMIGEAQLKLMRPDAFLINTARGAIVDEAALIKALQEGWIAGAALDVLEHEPPQPDNPLLKMDNVILTPHVSGHTANFMEDAYNASVDLLIGFARGQRPASIVNGV